ncbi:MAG: hypothetical protein M1831_001601 [Alyxoria varia]|nr:MAG: hypothetical protein M1831_001601 [Alyxoria varia]
MLLPRDMQQFSRVLWDISSYQDVQDSSAEERGTKDGHNPVNIRICAPPVPEEADRDEKRSHHSWGKSHFWLDYLAFLVELLLLYLENIPTKEWKGYQGANEETKECQTRRSKAKSVNSLENERQRIEPDEQDAKDQSDPQVQ